MDSLLSPTFRTRTQKFYYENNPDTTDSNGVAASPASVRKTPTSAAKEATSAADSGATSGGGSPRGKASFFTFDHVPSAK